jgi:phospholipid-binding lipoprotein MlaA
VWRIGRGPYLVLPVFGPTTLRDAVGGVGDGFLDPLEWELIEKIDGYDWTWSAALEAVDAVQALPGQLAAYDAALEGAIDPYLALRSSYVQNRDAETRR